MQMLWRRKVLIGLGGALGFVLGLLFYSQQRPVYQSVSKVLVIRKEGSAFSSLDPTGGHQMVLVSEDFLSTHMMVVKSPAVIARVVRHQGWTGAQPVEEKHINLPGVVLRDRADSSKDAKPADEKAEPPDPW